MAFRPMFRRAVVSAVPLCALPVAACSGPQEDSGLLHRLRSELAKLRPTEADFRARWIKEEEGWHKLPPRAWPPVQPNASAVPELAALLEADRCPPAGERMSDTCRQTTFDLATAYVFSGAEPKKGLEMYQAMAVAGDTDSMVAAGVTLVEGLGVTADDSGTDLLLRASELGNAQGLYEVAVLLLLGDGGLPMDEERAFSLFERAAGQRHSAGMFMAADCLLEGVGCKPDPARAVPLLKAAAELGHRGARQHLRQLLDGSWYGFDQAASEPQIVL